jgi:hypothetical protein
VRYRLIAEDPQECALHSGEFHDPLDTPLALIGVEGITRPHAEAGENELSIDIVPSDDADLGDGLFGRDVLCRFAFDDLG